MGFRSEFLALAFGVLLVLVTFGDAHIYWSVGNLDTIFGVVFWRLLDVIYPLATIAVFLLYGWVKGNGLKFDAVTAFLFASFLVLLLLISLDDVAQALNLTLELSRAYWIAVSFIYPVFSTIAFFLFGAKEAKLKSLKAQP